QPTLPLNHQLLPTAPLRAVSAGNLPLARRALSVRDPPPTLPAVSVSPARTLAPSLAADCLAAACLSAPAGLPPGLDAASPGAARFGAAGTLPPDLRPFPPSAA